MGVRRIGICYWIVLVSTGYSISYLTLGTNNLARVVYSM